MSDIIKLRATADILGGEVFRANENGADPENLSNNDLLANGMYIRLKGSDGSIAYVSAHEVDKALGIINDITLSKASAADVAALQESVNTKASISDLELLNSLIAEKASKSDVDDLQDIFAEKADQTTVDALIEQLNEKASQEFAESIMAEIEAKASVEALTELTTTVDAKASSADLAELQADLETLQATVNALTDADSIAAITNQINYLNTEIQKRLTIDDLRTVNTNLNTLNANYDDLLGKVELAENNVNKAASKTYVQGQVNELNTAITGLATRMDYKADKSELSSKASKTELENAVKRVTTISSTLSNLEVEVDNNYDELTTLVNKKASKSDIDTAINGISTSMDGKADKSEVNSEINRINNRLRTLESNTNETVGTVQTSISNVQTAVNNSLSEIRSTVNSQSRTLTNQGNQITKLQESSSNYADQLKQTWVRVLSTNEYRKLTTPPEGVPYNPRYKYPNTVYLVVDFNKPKAIYIGDILIAKSEQGGSVGFAYTFPIIF